MTRLALVAGAPLWQQPASRRGRTVNTGSLVFQSADALGPTATADATTAHTPGAWAEIVPSLANDADVVVGMFNSSISTSNVATSTLLDFAVGAAGSEVIVVPGLNVGYRTSNSGPIIMPLAIPAGSRVAFRAQSAVLSKAVQIRWAFYQTGTPAPRSLPAFGVNTATSRGVDPAGTTVNVDGAWSTLVDTVPEPLSALIVTLSGAGGTSYASATQVVDIGVGAAGNETVIVSDVLSRLDSSENLIQSWCGPFPVHVPAGARLSCRMNRANASNAVSVVAHGVKLT